MKKQKIALISVYNKEGITDFAKSLVDLGWKVISSGGTAKHLTDAGISVTDVAEITGMSPILDHRVLTLHPRIHGGLLALDTPEHLNELEKYNIPWIDMVCIDFYPLEEETSKFEATHDSVIEKTDIGGPTMVRSAAKGGRIVICDKEDRTPVIKWLKAGEPDRENFLNNLRAKAEATVSRYCAISAEYHSSGFYNGFLGEMKMECKYGENAWQTPAKLFKISNKDPLAMAHGNFNRVAGEPMSYNNLCDLDRMLQTTTHIAAGFKKNFSAKGGSVSGWEMPKIAIGVKHGNPCGASVAEDAIEAVDKMLEGDLRAIFGGSVMLNFPVDEKIAEELIHKYVEKGRRLLDVIVAPSFTNKAIEILSRKKGKCKLLANPAIEKAGLDSLDNHKRFRYVRGGFIEQPNYTFVPNMSKSLFDSRVLQDVVLAWAVGATSNSNTITIVKGGRLYGNGVGQQDRVGAAKLAIFRADDAANFADSNIEKADLENATAYSDSFFPFPDGVEVLIKRGIKTIFSTSGSVNDDKITELCKSKGVNLIMLPDKEARGFYQH